MGRCIAWTRCAAIVLALTVSACGGGGSSTPTSPSPSPSPAPSPTPTPSPGGTTITISSTGVASPKNITIAIGSRVTFVNNDVRPHEMNSNPHPEHTDCPALNDVGFIQAGQTRLTGNLTTARTCGFHDHAQSSNANLQGTITIQ